MYNLQDMCLFLYSFSKDNPRPVSILMLAWQHHCLRHEQHSPCMQGGVQCCCFLLFNLPPLLDSLDETTLTRSGTEFLRGTYFLQRGDIIRRGARRRCNSQLIFVVRRCRDNRITIAEQDNNCRDVTVAPGQRINFMIQQLC